MSYRRFRCSVAQEIFINGLKYSRDVASRKYPLCDQRFHFFEPLHSAVIENHPKLKISLIASRKSPFDHELFVSPDEEKVAVMLFFQSEFGASVFKPLQSLEILKGKMHKIDAKKDFYSILLCANDTPHEIYAASETIRTGIRSLLTSLVALKILAEINHQESYERRFSILNDDANLLFLPVWDNIANAPQLATPSGRFKLSLEYLLQL